MTVAPERGSRSSRSWMNKALLAAFVVASGTMVSLIAASFFVPPMVDRWVETYTDAEPMRTGVAPADEAAERDAVEARLDAFIEGLDEDGGVESELVLSEDELRLLISTESDVTKPRIGMETKLLPGRIRAAVSVPIEEDVSLGPWQAETKGRYLNGYAVIRVTFARGSLELEVESVETTAGDSFPGWATSLLNRTLDRERAGESEDAREVLDKLERLEIRQGELVLQAKIR